MTREEFTAENIQSEIEAALQMFGTYTYHDKGAREVMDMTEHCAIAREILEEEDGADALLEILTALETLDVDAGSYLSDLICGLDDCEGDEAERFFDSELVGRFY